MDRREIERRIREVYQAFAAGDRQAYRSACAEDFVWHVPGDNPVSGAYRGLDEYFGAVPALMAPLTEWRIEPRRVMVNERDRTVLVSFRVHGLRRGVGVDMNGFHVIRLDEEGLIREGWDFAEDQDALDAFFSA
jgi:ketosteroid isomerase-like protein